MDKRQRWKGGKTVHPGTPYVDYIGADDKVAMSSKTFSIIVRCWYDQQADATQLQVVRVDTAKNVRLGDGSFLLRISLDETAPSGRCFIRHLASGREAFVQGGPSLHAFIKDCLLNSGEPELDDAGKTNETTIEK